MFQAVMEEAIVFKKIIESIKDLVQQVNIEATPEGLSLQAMDSAHVSLIHLKMIESGFKTYRCDKNITLGINLVDLSKVLKMAQNDDQLTLKASSDVSFLNLLMENKKSNKDYDIQLPLLTLESESYGIPETEYPTIISMSSGEFFRICKEMSALTDTIQISVQDSKQAVISYKGKVGTGKLTLKNNTSDKEGESLTIKCDEPVDTKYGLQYINSFSKASSLSSSVDVSLSMNFPLMIGYEIADLGFIKFYLAPKISEDE